MRNSHDTQNFDVLRHVAERVADCIADTGYAYVEDDNIEGLVATLGSFLTVAGIPGLPAAGIRPRGPCCRHRGDGSTVATRLWVGATGR
jgi:hypothetical protein